MDSDESLEERNFRYVKPDALEDGEKYIKEVIFPVYYSGQHFHRIVFETPKSILETIRLVEDFLSEEVDDDYWQIMQNKIGKSRREIEDEHGSLDNNITLIKRFNGIFFTHLEALEIRGDFLYDSIRLTDYNVDKGLLIIKTEREAVNQDVK